MQVIGDHFALALYRFVYRRLDDVIQKRHGLQNHIGFFAIKVSKEPLGSHSRDLMEFEERMYTITVQPAELREKLASSRQKIKDLGCDMVEKM